MSMNVHMKNIKFTAAWFFSAAGHADWVVVYLPVLRCCLLIVLALDLIC